MVWNYRVMKYKTINDEEEVFKHKIIVVHYEDDGSIMGWVDSGHTQLDWESYNDLETTVGWIGYAFDKPVLLLMEDDKLMEEAKDK